jgi:hypothetical protein
MLMTKNLLEYRQLGTPSALRQIHARKANSDAEAGSWKLETGS